MQIKRTTTPPSLRATDELKSDIQDNSSNSTSLSNVDKQLIEASALKMQAQFHRLRKIKNEKPKLNSKGLYEVRHPGTDEVVGFVHPKQGMHKPGERITRKIYPNLDSSEYILDTEEALRGGTKTLTHRRNKPEFIKRYGTGYVGLTMHDDLMEWLPNDAFHLSHEALEKILALNLSHVVVQREVSPGFFVAPQFDMDLVDRVNTGQPLPFAGFKGFLEDLKTLHENELVHRDITAPNLLVKDDEVYLTDLDSTDFVTHLTPVRGLAGTPEYRDTKLVMHIANMLRNNLRRGTAELGLYAKTMDQYGAIVTMIASESRQPLKQRHPNNFSIADFTSNAMHLITDWARFHAKPEYLENIYQILFKPMKYSQKHKHRPPHLVDMLKW